MSDQFLASIFTLGLFMLMIARVPFLDFPQYIVGRLRERPVSHSSIIQAANTDKH
jgi:hypothetical protein